MALVLRILVRVVLASALAVPALAQDWPSRPVRFLMPSNPGASNDVIGRALAARLAAKWKQPVVVENKPGAGTSLATDVVARSTPDGLTFGWIITAHAINPGLRPLPYDTLRDLSGVTPLYQIKAVIVAAPTVPAATIPEFIAWVKAQPGGIAFATTSTGSGPHLLGELFRLKYGLDMRHVPYRGTTGHPDLLAGRVPVLFDALPNALAHVKAGRMKLLAVVSETPVKDHPEFPILPDLLPRGAVLGWNGIVVAAGTPRPIVNKLAADIQEAMDSPEVRALLGQFGVDVLRSTPEAFDAFIRDDIARWGDVIRRAGIRFEGGG